MADDDGVIMKTMVFIVVFSALFAFLFAYSSPIFSGADPPQDDQWIQNIMDPEEIAQTTFWENAGGSTGGYNVTDATVWNDRVTPEAYLNIDGHPSSSGTRFDFGEPGTDASVNVFPMAHELDEGAVTIGVNDSFVIYQAWGWYDKKYSVITFDQIAQNVMEKDTNLQAKMHVQLEEGMSIWFIFPLNSDPMEVLQSGKNFAIVVGQSLLDQLEGTQNVWNALAGLITFNIDTGSSVLNYLISLPIWLCVAFITYTIVKGLIPGL